jgi:hypothetical protein
LCENFLLNPRIGSVGVMWCPLKNDEAGFGNAILVKTSSGRNLVATMGFYVLELIQNVTLICRTWFGRASPCEAALGAGHLRAALDRVSVLGQSTVEVRPQLTTRNLCKSPET